MGWLDRGIEIREALRIAQYGSNPRPLTDRDREYWNDAVNRRNKPTMPRGRIAVRLALKSVNGARLRRMDRDIKWIKKHLVRMGLNPEDWSEYL